MHPSYWAKALVFNFPFFKKLSMTLRERFAQGHRPAFYFCVSRRLKLFNDVCNAATYN